MKPSHPGISSILGAMLITALASTVILAVVYVTAQQNLRMGANDPQIQMAEDAAHSIEQGQVPSGAPTPANLTQTLAPFIIIFDDKDASAFSTVQLNGKVPAPPQGVFDYVRTHGQDRITWQPQPGLRIATVIQRTKAPKAGFVLVGRSLREVEVRESQLTLQVGGGWVATMLVILASGAFSILRLKRRDPIV